MRRRDGLVLLVGGPGVALGAIAQARPRRVLVIHPLGVPDPGVDPLAQRLRELGNVEGRDFVIEVIVSAPPSRDLPRRLAELLQRPPDVIVAGTTLAAQMARDATRTLPIVMAISGDPVADGLVESFAQPGGNVTGLSIMNPEVNAKRMQLLMEAVPGLKRIALLLETDGPRVANDLHEHEEAARRLGLMLIVLPVRGPQDIEGAFQEARRQGAQGLLMPQTPGLLFAHRVRLGELALAHRLPAAGGHGDDRFTRAGGLMNYGANIEGNWRRSGDYVHKILRGAKPAELPVEQPDRIELTINQRSAQALGLTLAPHLLMIAHEVIR